MAEKCAFPGCKTTAVTSGYCIGHAKMFAGTSLKPQTESKAKKSIKKQSDKQKAATKEYNKLRKIYLAAHPKCEVGAKDCTKQATEVHHKAGRVGKKLTDAKGFLAVCHSCHVFIENNPVKAKQAGYSKPRLTA